MRKARLEKVAPEADMVSHPPHYLAVDRNGVKHETVDCCEAHGLESALAQAVQYIMRADKKGRRLEDLQKAQWWLRRAIENTEIANAKARGIVLKITSDGRSESIRVE